MVMHPVNSSNLSRVGYDEQTNTLYIEFHSGGTYCYFNVPSSVFNDLMQAPSHGVYFHRHIKNWYNWRKL